MNFYHRSLIQKNPCLLSKFAMEKILFQFVPILMLSLIVFSNAEDNLLKKQAETCAVLNKEEGDQHIFRDAEQVRNFGGKPITAINSSNKTSSISVRTDCSLTLCNETNFTGYCHQFSKSQQEIPPGFGNILSGSCTCEKVSFQNYTKLSINHDSKNVTIINNN